MSSGNSAQFTRESRQCQAAQEAPSYNGQSPAAHLGQAEHRDMQPQQAAALPPRPPLPPPPLGGGV